MHVRILYEKTQSGSVHDMFLSIPSRYPIMAIRPFHKVYPPGTPNGHSAVLQGILIGLLMSNMVYFIGQFAGTSGSAFLD